MGRVIFHIDLDAFFVSVERVLDPSLKGKPVVVGGDPRGRGVVSCASYEARPYGLHAGMPLGEAKRLCPQAIFISGRFEHYERASAHFMRILGEYAPHMESGGLDEAYADMTGTELLNGEPFVVAELIRRRVREEIGITASVGISSNKVVSKVASDHCKPDGLLEIAPGDERKFLAPLPVRKLWGVGEKVSAALEGELNIRTIGQLAEASPAVIHRRFGAWGDLLHLWANGIDDSPVSQRERQKSHSRETTFAKDIEDVQLLRATMRYLGERVGATMRSEGQRGRRVVLKLRYANFDTIVRHRTLRSWTNADAEIFAAGEALLKKALQERGGPVRLIGIGVSELQEATAQMPLFEEAMPRNERLAKALDAVRDKHGFTVIETGLARELKALYKEEKGDYALAPGPFSVSHRAGRAKAGEEAKKSRGGYVLATPALSR
ncbi:MAG: DNA polymerase IV [Chloroflexi bacterium]|nr:DNA polymerase IV [Chloroflexota bacterium]